MGLTFPTSVASIDYLSHIPTPLPLCHLSFSILAVQGSLAPASVDLLLDVVQHVSRLMRRQCLSSVTLPSDVPNRYPLRSFSMRSASSCLAKRNLKRCTGRWWPLATSSSRQRRRQGQPRRPQRSAVSRVQPSASQRTAKRGRENCSGAWPTKPRVAANLCPLVARMMTPAQAVVARQNLKCALQANGAHARANDASPFCWR